MRKQYWAFRVLTISLARVTLDEREHTIESARGQLSLTEPPAQLVRINVVESPSYCQSTNTTVHLWSKEKINREFGSRNILSLKLQKATRPRETKWGYNYIKKLKNVITKGAYLSSMRLWARNTTETTVKVHALENKVNSFININCIHTTLCVYVCVWEGGGVLWGERERERLLEARHTNSPKVARPQNENRVSTSPVRGQITLHFFLLVHYSQWGNRLMNSPFEWQTEKKTTCDKKSPIMWCNHNNNIILILLIW